MSISQTLTKAQQQQIANEQKRYDAAKAAAEKAGKKFDPLNDAPTPKSNETDPVQIEIQKIWAGKGR